MGKMSVAVVMGSGNDAPKMEGCFKALNDFGVPFTKNVMSAHRTPDDAAEFAKSLLEKNVGVVICAAGQSAHLAGVFSAFTVRPVIAVPIVGTFMGGLDSLLSMVQMPSGIPVGCVAAHDGGPTNAALLAIEILAVSDAGLTQKLLDYKKELARKTKEADAKLNMS